MPFQPPKPVIKKRPITRKPPKPKSTKQHAIELESKLGSSLEVAAGGITTLTNNLVARQSKSGLTKDEQLSRHITRLGAISVELKAQLRTLGGCSKLSSQQDQQSFDLSYRRVLALWNEYRRVSACVVQRARVCKQKGSKGDDTSASTVMSSSSTTVGMKKSD